MNQNSREDLIRAISPYTPNSPTEPVLVLNGVSTPVHGACIMMPHLCMSSLVPGNKLIELMDARADAEKDEEQVNYEDYHFLKRLISTRQISGRFMSVVTYI